MNRVAAKLAHQARCSLGEGSLWDVETQRLFFVDIIGHKVFRFDPETGAIDDFDVGQDVGTVVLDEDGKLILGLRSGVARFDMTTGSTRPLVAPEPNTPGNRLNDGKCDPRGRFFVGSMVEDGNKGNGGLYAVDASLSVRKVLAGIDCSNGLVWSRDEATFYYIDTPTQRVRAFDYDAEGGTLGKERVAFELPKSLGAPDGMTIDEHDHLWIALWGGSKVLRVDPLQGRVVFEVDVPAERVTSCAFGGKNLDHLFITTAAVGAKPDELERLPLTGSLFVAETGFRGVPSRRFARTT